MKEVNHQIKSFERVTNLSCFINNKSGNFNIKLYRVGTEYYLMFYNNIFYQLNKIDSSDIIVDHSQSYDSKKEAIFHVNINKLKYNKKIL